jgi:hypothetical protein
MRNFDDWLNRHEDLTAKLKATGLSCLTWRSALFFPFALILSSDAVSMAIYMLDH